MDQHDLRDLGEQVLITGAKGFIGRALHMKLPHARGVGRGASSLAIPASLEAPLKGVRVIFHLAGVNAGSGYTPSTDSMAQDNVLATYGLLQGIKRFASAKPLVVFLSSIHVYRNSDR
jgi:nucleoside-diphosphate-sugar epimerase